MSSSLIIFIPLVGETHSEKWKHGMSVWLEDLKNTFPNDIFSFGFEIRIAKDCDAIGLTCSLEQTNTIVNRAEEYFKNIRIYRMDIFNSLPVVHFQTQETLGKYLQEAQKEKRVVIGESAVERALQRRQLSLVLIANNAENDFYERIQKIIGQFGRKIDVQKINWDRRELGTFLGVHRATIVGIKGTINYLKLSPIDRKPT